jgi:hypothetical protein
MGDHLLQVRRDCRQQRGEIARRDDGIRKVEKPAQVLAFRLQLALARKRFLVMAHIVDPHCHLPRNVLQEADVALSVGPFARRRESEEPHGSERGVERQETRGALTELSQRRDYFRVFASSVKRVQHDPLVPTLRGGSQALLIERRKRDRLNIRRSGRLGGSSEPDGVQLRSFPFDTRKDDTEQVEVGDRSKASREVRQDFVDTGITTDEIDHAEQRS